MSENLEISFRERIRLNLLSAMKVANISQVQLAERLGISKGTVNNWTRGNNSPDVEIVPKICDVLGISLSDLFAPSEIERSTSSKKVTPLVPGGKGERTVSESEYRIVSAYRVASAADRDVIDNIVGRYAPPPVVPPADKDLTRAEKVALYDQQLRLEEEQEKQASSVNESGAG